MPDMRGIKVENREKQIKGMAVTSPTSVGVRRSWWVISGITGPIDVMGARKLAAIRMILKSITAPFHVIFLSTIFINYN
jgi:hypothetical protein